jgi:hypothetical protein
MNTRFLPSIVFCALTAAVAVCVAGESKLTKKDLPIAVLELKWTAPEADTVCPSNSVVRNLSAKPCVLKSADGMMIVTVPPGETVYTGIEFRFQNVPAKVEMTTIPFGIASAAMEKANKRKE